MYGCDRCVSTGCLSGSVTRVGQDLSGSVTRVGQDLSGSVNLVCTPNRGYLDVVPDVVWLTQDMLASADFEIYSDLTWKID